MEARQVDRSMEPTVTSSGQTVTVLIPSEAGQDDVGFTFSGVDIADVTDALTSHLHSTQFPAAEKPVKYVGYPPPTAEQQQPFQVETMRADSQVPGMTEKEFVNWTSKLSADSGGSKLLVRAVSSSYPQAQPSWITQSQPRQVKNKMAVSTMQADSDLSSNSSNLKFPVVMTPVTHSDAQRMAFKLPLLNPNSVQSLVNVDNPVGHQSKSLKNVIFIAQPQKASPVATSMPVYNIKQQSKSYNVVSPVYQSKLEKAVARPRKMNKNSVKFLPKTASAPANTGKEIVIVNVTAETNPDIRQLSVPHTAESRPDNTATNNAVTDGDISLIDPRSLTGKIATRPEIDNQQQESSTELPPENVNTCPKSPVLASPPVSESVTNPAFNLLLPPVSQSPETFKAKEYEDETLGRCMLGEMWHLLQVASTCDAILYTGPMFDTPVKVHKIVLAAISPVIQQQVCNMNDQLLKLKLPADIDVLVVNQFVYYIYHARLTITTDNVRDLYRISTIFNIEQLKKYCYDFCKLAGLGHLIINSPDREAIKALPVTDHTDQVQANDTINEDGDHVGGNAGKDKNLDVVREKVTKKEIFVKPSPKKNAKKSAIDWMGSDDMQRNIPIRKRGRTRKGMSAESKLSTNTEAMSDIKNDVSIINCGKNTPQMAFPDSVEQTAADNPMKQDMIPANLNSNNKTTDVTSIHLKTGPTDIKTKNKKCSETRAQLPDPFQSGQFDDSQLSPPPMSVLTRNQLKQKDFQVDEAASTDVGTMQVVSISPTDRTDKPLKRKGKRSLTTTTPSKSMSDNSKPDSLETDISSETPAVPSKKTRLRKSGNDEREPLPMKEVVHMRPPPKKRTKEIHEMMKNEVQIQKDQSSPEPPTDVLHKDHTTTGENEQQKLSVKPVSKRKRTTPFNKDMAQLSTALFEKSKSLVGIIHFKCLYCGNEFTMGKRAINHVLNTHDVQIYEVLEHISVENGKFSPKVCDLCGYKTKDNNFDYIHMHKYFRHGIALPKGCKPFTCDLCKKEFFTKFQLRDHKLIHFEDNPFCCEHCGSRFNSRNSLNSHVFHKHNSIRRHKCTLCVKSFKTMTQMLVHFRTHSGERPFKCPDCDYKSTTRGNLRLHLTNRHKLKAEVIKTIMSQLKASSFSLEEFENDIQHQKSLVFDSKAKKELSASKKQKQHKFNMSISASNVEPNNSGAVGITTITPSANPHILVTVLNPDKEIVIENDGSELIFDNRMIPGLVPEYQEPVAGSSSEVVPLQLHKPAPPQLLEEIYLPIQGVADKGDAHRSVERFVHDGLQYRDMPAPHVIIIDGKQVTLVANDPATVQDSNVTHYDAQTRDLAHTVFPEQGQLENDMYAMPQDMGVPVQLREPSRNDVTRPARRIDPHSREARMLVREVLQEHNTKSLLKAAFLNNQIDNQPQNMEQKDLDSTVQANQNLFQEGQSISMETMKGEGHYLTPDGHIISGRRSAMHDIRTETVGTSIERHLMEADDVVQLMPLNYASAPPPLYSTTSHGLVNMVDTEIQVTTPDTMHTTTSDHTQPNNAHYQPPQTTAELDPAYVQVNQDADTQQQYDQNAAMFNSYKMYYPQNYQ